MIGLSGYKKVMAVPPFSELETLLFVCFITAPASTPYHDESGFQISCRSAPRVSLLPRLYDL